MNIQDICTRHMIHKLFDIFFLKVTYKWAVFSVALIYCLLTKGSRGWCVCGVCVCVVCVCVVCVCCVCVCCVCVWCVCVVCVCVVCVCCVCVCCVCVCCVCVLCVCGVCVCCVCVWCVCVLCAPTHTHTWYPLWPLRMILSEGEQQTNMRQ